MSGHENVTGAPRFSAAWPVRYSGSEDEILWVVGEYPVIRSRRVGRGTLIVVGDCDHFRDKALEGDTPTLSCAGGDDYLPALRDLVIRHSTPKGH